MRLQLSGIFSSTNPLCAGVGVLQNRVEGNQVTKSLSRIHLPRRGEARRAQLDCVLFTLDKPLTNPGQLQHKHIKDRSQIPHLWNRVCLMNNAIIISTVDHRLKNHSAEGHRRLEESVLHFSQWHKQIHYLNGNFPPVGTINESDFSSSQLSGTEQVGLLKSHCGFTLRSQAKD